MSSDRDINIHISILIDIHYADTVGPGMRTNPGSIRNIFKCHLTFIET